MSSQGSVVRGWAILALVATLGNIAPARAQTAPVPAGQIFSVDPVADGLGAFALTGSALLLDRNKNRWTFVEPCHGVRRAPTAEDLDAYARLPADGGVCDASEVVAIDRWLLSRAVWQPAARISDILLWTLVASPLAFSAIDTLGAGVTAARVGDDTAVTFQALGATYLATMTLKMLVSRPRPLTYDRAFDKSVRFAGSARLSFPSGHAALSFAAASVLAVMVGERFGNQPAAVAGIAAGYVAAGTVATFRVLGRKHFLSDVVAGAALGTALGLTIPLLHTKTRAPTGSQRGAAPPVLSFGGAF